MADTCGSRVAGTLLLVGSSRTPRDFRVARFRVSSPERQSLVYQLRLPGRLSRVVGDSRAVGRHRVPVAADRRRGDRKFRYQRFRTLPSCAPVASNGRAQEHAQIVVVDAGGDLRRIGGTELTVCHGAPWLWALSIPRTS